MQWSRSRARALGTTLPLPTVLLWFTERRGEGRAGSDVAQPARVVEDQVESPQRVIADDAVCTFLLRSDLRRGESGRDIVELESSEREQSNVPVAAPYAPAQPCSEEKFLLPLAMNIKSVPMRSHRWVRESDVVIAVSPRSVEHAPTALPVAQRREGCAGSFDGSVRSRSTQVGQYSSTGHLLFRGLPCRHPTPPPCWSVTSLERNHRSPRRGTPSSPPDQPGRRTCPKRATTRVGLPNGPGRAE